MMPPKTAARKTTAPKTAARKTTAPKTVAPKTVARKTMARKTMARKTAARGGDPSGGSGRGDDGARGPGCRPARTAAVVGASANIIIIAIATTTIARAAVIVAVVGVARVPGPAQAGRPDDPPGRPPRPASTARREPRLRPARPGAVPRPGRARRRQPPHHRLRHRHRPQRPRHRPRLPAVRPPQGKAPRRPPTRPLTALPARLNLTIPATRLTQLLRPPPQPPPAPAATPARPRATDRLGPHPARRPPARTTRRATRPGAGPGPITLPSGLHYTVPLEPVPTHHCDHRRQSDAYEPNDALRHLVQIRDHECTLPTCSRPAKESDFEHAVPYDQGGRTCACNAGARSRACHQVKTVTRLESHPAQTRLAPMANPQRPHLHPRTQPIPRLTSLDRPAAAHLTRRRPAAEAAVPRPGPPARTPAGGVPRSARARGYPGSSTPVTRDARPRERLLELGDERNRPAGPHINRRHAVPGLGQRRAGGGRRPARSSAARSARPRRRSWS